MSESGKERWKTQGRGEHTIKPPPPPQNWDLSDHLQSPKRRNPKNSQKVSKKSPERSLGPPDPGPTKSSEKSPKVQKKELILTIFWTFFGTFQGSGVGGSQTPLGRLFLRLLGFRGLGLRRWRARSQPKKQFWNLPPSMVRSPPFVHALSFSLETTGTDQTNLSFCGFQNWFVHTSPPPQKKAKIPHPQNEGFYGHGGFAAGKEPPENRRRP